MRFTKKPKLPNYDEFSLSIISSLNTESKHQLFYYSLFDPSSWEEEAKDFVSKELGKEAINIIKKVNKKFFRKFLDKPEKKEHFLKSFVYSDELTRFLIASELENSNIYVKKESLSTREGPDIIVMHKEKMIMIEIKRLVSCSSLRGRIYTEIIPQISNYNCDKIILLFLFPQIGEENEERISKLIDAVYITEDLIGLKTNKNVKVLCWYVKKEYVPSSDFLFKKIIEKLIELL